MHRGTDAWARRCAAAVPATAALTKLQRHRLKRKESESPEQREARLAVDRIKAKERRAKKRREEAAPALAI